MHELTVPRLGIDDDQSVFVSSWLVGVGDTVIEGDRVVELLIGEITFDVPSPVNGRLRSIEAEVDDSVHVGSRLGWIEIE